MCFASSLRAESLLFANSDGLNSLTFNISYYCCLLIFRLLSSWELVSISTSFVSLRFENPINIGFKACYFCFFGFFDLFGGENDLLLRDLDAALSKELMAAPRLFPYCFA